MPAHTPLNIHYDSVMDILTVEGINYSGALMREFAHGLALGQPFRIIGREESRLTIERIDMSRIKLGPMEMSCQKCGAKDVVTIDIENPNTSIPKEATLEP